MIAWSRRIEAISSGNGVIAAHAATWSVVQAASGSAKRVLRATEVGVLSSSASATVAAALPRERCSRAGASAAALVLSHGARCRCCCCCSHSIKPVLRGWRPRFGELRC